MKFELSSDEVNTILDALSKEYKNTTQRKSWRPSEKALHMANVNRIRNSLVSQEMEGDKE